MKKMVIFTIACLCMINSITVFAACPSADLSGDCRVDLDDFTIMASEWLSVYDCNDLVVMASEWLDDGAFVTTWDTSLGTGPTVTLALAGTVDATIDWGDGSAVEHVTTPGPHVHDYDVDGIYTVSVTGSVTAYDSWANGGVGEAKLIRVDNWGRLGFTSMYRAFYGCSNLVSVPGTSDGIEAVKYMSYMFDRASSFNGNISGWDTSNVKYMRYMFNFASAFNQPIGGWDTSNVTDMYMMFSNASAFNGNIGGWDTSNVTNMSYMFASADLFNGNIGGWETSKVVNMKGMFYGASSFNQDIGGWDTLNVTDMSYMFYYALAFNQDLSGWCVTKITSEPGLFDAGASSWELESWRPVWGTCP